MISTYVVIPFRGKLEMTDDLVRQLRNDCHDYPTSVKIHLFNNGDPLEPYAYPWSDIEDDWPLIYTHEAKDVNLHKMMNWGINCGLSSELEWYDNEESTGDLMPFNVAVLNNDITIDTPHWLDTLALALRSAPTLAAVSSCEAGFPEHEGRYTVVEQNYDGHFQGNALMVRGELPFRFDERFEWHYGDVDLVAQYHNAGWSTGVAPACRHTHLDGGSLTVKAEAANIDYVNGCARDAMRFRKKWPQIFPGSKSIPQEYLMQI